MKTLAKLNQQDRNETQDTITEALAGIVEMLNKPSKCSVGDLNLIAKQARFALQERDSLKALNADLLQALEDLLEQCSRTYAGIWWDRDSFKDYVATVARSAIARAKGQSV